MSSDTIGKPNGFLSFEEKIATQIEAATGELESRIAEGSAMLAQLRGMDGAEKGAKRDSGRDGPPLDPLTGLYTRQEIFRRLLEEKSRADRTVRLGEPGFALLVIDIENFRRINSAYGLKAGDMLLARIGQFIKSSVRAYDSIGRFGGDEFIVLLPGASKSQATRIAKEAIEKFSLWRGFREELSMIAGKPESELESLSLDCSVGISDYLSEGKRSRSDVDAVVSRAEYALYRARRSGKRRYAVWGHTKELGDA